MTVVVFEMTLETVGKGKSRPPFPLHAPVCFSPALASPPHSPLLPSSLPSPQETQLLESFCREGLQGVACELKYVSKNGLCHHLEGETTLLTLGVLLLTGRWGHSLTSGLLVSRLNSSGLEVCSLVGPWKVPFLPLALFLLPLSFYLNMGPQ